MNEMTNKKSGPSKINISFDGLQWKRILTFGFGGIFALILLFNSIFLTDAGYIYVYQNNITGNMSVYTEPGIHYRVPMLSKVTKYKQVTTISFGGGSYVGLTRQLPFINVRFADTYTGKIPTAFRFKLSTAEDKIIRMHREFRTFSNLIDAMLVKNARNVTVITATQYTGEEFFQGGLNQFKAQLEDQLRLGIYQTRREQVEVLQIGITPVGVNQGNSHKLEESRQLVWKTVPIKGANGKPIRLSNPLDQYGIKVTQVTVGDPVPERQLSKLLTDKKTLVAERIKTIQEQETAKAQAKTAQLKKEIERTRAVQDAQRHKELAVISQQKEVAVAQQIALKAIVIQQKKKDVAVIQKKKELEIAQANLEIQKANAQAAKFEAIAIREKGNAEADVTMAKYKALGANKAIYLAEVNRDIANVLYRNLKDFKIEMPKNYITHGGNNSNALKSNLDVLTAFGALGIMDKTLKLNKRTAANSAQ